jgi:hypothetical protein
MKGSWVETTQENPDREVRRRAVIGALNPLIRHRYDKNPANITHADVCSMGFDDYIQWMRDHNASPHSIMRGIRHGSIPHATDRGLSAMHDHFFRRASDASSAMEAVGSWNLDDPLVLKSTEILISLGKIREWPYQVLIPGHAESIRRIAYTDAMVDEKTAQTWGTLRQGFIPIFFAAHHWIPEDWMPHDTRRSKHPIRHLTNEEGLLSTASVCQCLSAGIPAESLIEMALTYDTHVGITVSHIVQDMQ